MSEQKRILEMIQTGQITAEEGMELLNALKESQEEFNNEIEVTRATPKRKFRFLKIRVLSEDDAKVAVNIPLKLVKSLGGLTSSISSYIPESAKDTMDEQGINLDKIDIVELIESIEEGAAEGSLIDIETEEDGEKTKVKVFVE